MKKKMINALILSLLDFQKVFEVNMMLLMLVFVLFLVKIANMLLSIVRNSLIQEGNI
jgi:hypothetical protein